VTITEILSTFATITKSQRTFFVKKLNAVVKTLLNSKAEMIFTDKLKNYQYLIPQELHNTKRWYQWNRKKESRSQDTSEATGQKTICFSRSIIILSAIL